MKSEEWGRLGVNGSWAPNDVEYRFKQRSPKGVESLRLSEDLSDSNLVGIYHLH